MNKNEIMPTNEIVGAILQTHANDEDLEKFKSSPSGFLQEHGVDMTTEVGVVENESAMVHLCLPYYESFDKAVANAIADDKLGYISGGELVLTIVTATVGVGFATIGVAAIASTLGYTLSREDKKGPDGKAK